MIFARLSAFMRMTALSAVIRMDKEIPIYKHEDEMGGECCKRRDEEESIHRFAENA
jgi:hypothetical protein